MTQYLNKTLNQVLEHDEFIQNYKYHMLNSLAARMLLEVMIDKFYGQKGLDYDLDCLVLQITSASSLPEGM